MKQARLIPVFLALVGATLVPWSPAGAAPAHKLRCFGLEATHVGTSGADTWDLRYLEAESSDSPIVVVGLGGNDQVYGPEYHDYGHVYFCGGTGRDSANGSVWAMNGGHGRDSAFFQCWPRMLKSVERADNEDC